MIHYASPLLKEPMFAEYLNTESNFHEADRLSREALSLPMYLETEDSEVSYICDQLTNFAW